MSLYLFSDEFVFQNLLDAIIQALVLCLYFLHAFLHELFISIMPIHKADMSSCRLYF